MSYDLNDNVNETWEFQLGGHTYTARYPLVDEIDTLQKKMEKAQKDGDSNAVLSEMYKFVSSKSEGAPDIAKAMKGQNIRVLLNFSEMFKTEFGME